MLHVLIILLLLTPALGKHLIDDMPTGAGGLTAAGGGGGGRRGAASPEERLHFVQTAPTPPAAPAVQQPVLDKPRVAPPPIKPPEPIAVPRVQAAVTAPAPMALAAAPGTGGTGNDSTAGAGPGTGGGTGTGVGSGRGSEAGPGTGGGTGTIYPATPDFLVIPTLPVPKKLHGRTISVRFTLDDRGKVLKVESDASGDDGYDKQLRARLAEYRFRPAHRMDGTPVPSVYITQLTL
ncbi:MAG: energy transducer TonB [Gemmatimonadaceae bacterium]